MRPVQPTIGLLAWRGATAAASPLAGPFLRLRARQGKEDRARLPERLGHARASRPAGPLVWLHGASIGEGLALLPLVEALRARGLTTLVTTGTRTSAEVVGARLPPGAIHSYAPLDLPGAVSRFLDHWRPQTLLLAESELWPNIILGCAARSIPVALVNGRMSARSAARWARAPGAARALMRAVPLCLAQSDDHAARLSMLGARDVRVTGNVKYDVAPPPADPAALAALRATLGARPVVVAVSSHAADEAALAVACETLRCVRGLLIAVVPRDPARGAQVAAAFRGRVARRGAGGSPAEADVFVADAAGEVGLWLRMASVAVMGKTFVAGAEGGGQNPIEAARLGAAIAHGPSTFNFSDIYGALDAQDAALAAQDAAGLADRLRLLLGDPARRRSLARAAARVADGFRGATARSLAALEPLLPAPGTPSP